MRAGVPRYPILATLTGAAVVFLAGFLSLADFAPGLRAPVPSPTLFTALQTTRSDPQPPQVKSSDLSRSSASLDDWENRLMANDPKVRAFAEAALVQGEGRSLPLLRRLLNRPNQDLHVVTSEVIRRIGPPAIPLLVDLLRHDGVSIRRSAADALIDLAPHTESIQPA